MIESLPPDELTVLIGWVLGFFSGALTAVVTVSLQILISKEPFRWRAATLRFCLYTIIYGTMLGTITALSVSAPPIWDTEIINRIDISGYFILVLQPMLNVSFYQPPAEERES